jgi:hypothetical protein
MKTRTMVGALGLVAVATLLFVHGAQARRSAFHYYDGWWWGAAASARLDAKAAARAAHDAHDPDFLHRCYQPQRIGSGAYYTWRLVSVC